MSSSLTAQDRAALGIVMAVGECIRDLGRPVPSGEVYAHLMGHLTLESYTSVITVLKAKGLVEEKNHLLTWIGPVSGFAG